MLIYQRLIKQKALIRIFIRIRSIKSSVFNYNVINNLNQSGYLFTSIDYRFGLFKKSSQQKPVNLPIQQTEIIQQSKNRIFNLIFKSRFSKQGISINLEQIISQFSTELNLINNNQISKQKFKQLKTTIEKLDQIRVNIKLTEQNKNETKFQNNNNELVNAYIVLYKQLNDIVSQFLKQNQNKITLNSKFNELVLKIVQQFQLNQHYQHYIRLLIKPDKQPCTIQVQTCHKIINSISLVSNQLFNNTLPFHLQKYLNDFYAHRLIHMIQFDQNKQKDLEQKFRCQLILLKKIELIFFNTHLTAGKQFFYRSLINNNLHLFQKKQSNFIQSRLILAIQLVELLINTVNLNLSTINKLQNFIISYLSQVKCNVSSRNLTSLFNIYQKIPIPQTIYKTCLASYCYSSYSFDQAQFVKVFKFWVYSNCSDLKLLQILFQHLEQIAQISKGLNNKSKHIIHTLLHYVSIKYNFKNKNKLLKLFQKQCKPPTLKDHNILENIIKNIQGKILKDKQESYIKNKQRLNSPCITNKSSLILTKNIKSDQSNMQQKQFYSYLNQVIIKLSQQKPQFYQLKRQFSFCTFQLDFVLLRWQNTNKQKLLGYLAIQSVGLQYAYDPNLYKQNNTTNQIQSQQKTIKHVQSLIQYQKSLVFLRKKVIRQDILKHYGWKILYIPNRLLPQKHGIQSEKFKTLLMDAIKLKFKQ